MIGRPAYELILALLAIVGLTLGYSQLCENGPPSPGGLVGHTLGIVGFLLMLATQTLYSLRKRLPRFHYGPTAVWLQAHIFTGLVGAYMVLLHSSWRFNGVAGILTLVTIIVVISGAVG